MSRNNSNICFFCLDDGGVWDCTGERKSNTENIMQQHSPEESISVKDFPQDNVAQEDALCAEENNDKTRNVNMEAADEEL